MLHLLHRRSRSLSSNPAHISSSASGFLRCQASSPLAKPDPADTALRVLDLIAASKPHARRGSVAHAHSRLLQSCLRDVHAAPPAQKANASPPGPILDEDPIAVLLELHRKGLPPGVAAASGALSFLRSSGDLTTGSQIHSLSLKAGIDGSTAVSSSLVSLYSKCGRIHDARKVFDGMRLRDTVLYTSIIAAFAQHSQVGLCSNLFNEMRGSGFDPNDFTIASVLSVCTDTGWLGLGRSIHGVGMRMGFGRYPHVCNALISMYAKCGSIGEAAVVFGRMEQHRDSISWNAMISGFAQYGLAERALSLLEEMLETGAARPDGITFLGVLSACRHAGFVDGGYRCFHLMLDHGLKPSLGHYSCVVDLLGRAGLLEHALNFIKTMPIRPNGIIWGSLLSACKVHGNVRMGILAAQSRLLLEPECAVTHMQLANLYAALGQWNDVADMRKLMKDKGLKTNPGFSWIELGSRIYHFYVEAKTENDLNEEVYMLAILDVHMKELEFVPEAIFELENVALS